VIPIDQKSGKVRWISKIREVARFALASDVRCVATAVDNQVEVTALSPRDGKQLFTSRFEVALDSAGQSYTEEIDLVPSRGRVVVLASLGESTTLALLG
jgi:hypothetical protein